MNDRFRFRIINKETNKYEHPSAVEESSVFLLSRVSSKYIVEQCTGLEDRDRTPIYEGDIVEIDCKEFGAIKWHNELARFVIETEDTEADFDNYYPWEMRVIGNIHENPELLEGK